MSTFIAAYDVENQKYCLPAMRELVKLHEEFQIPATMYIVGKRLEEDGAEYRDLLANEELFEVASHTYSHRILQDHPICGKAPGPAEVREEVIRGVQLVEETFGRRCRGLRPGCGFVDGFQTAPEILELCKEAKLDYVSSHLWGPAYTMPSLLKPAYTYSEQGYPQLWEIPGHGWHDNVLKNSWTRTAAMIAWPPTMPEAVPPQPVATAEEEVAVNRVFLDTAKQDGHPFVSLVWHPHSLHRFSPNLDNVRLTFEHVRKLDLPCLTYAQYCDQLNAAQG